LNKIAIVKSSSSTDLETSTWGVGFQAFLSEAKKHMSPEEGSCQDTHVCRSLYEALYIAYHRNKLLQIELNVEKSLVASVHPYLNRQGVTRVVFTAPGLLGIKKKVPGVPLYR
jgi:hypothetical protein